MNTGALNSFAINAGYAAGIAFLSATTAADATVTSSAERLAKAYAVTQATASTEDAATRLSKPFGGSVATATASASAIRYAYALAPTNSYAEAADTAVRLGYTTPFPITGESITNAEALNNVFLASQWATGEAGTTATAVRWVLPAAKTNAVAYSAQDSAKTRYWSVRFVPVTGETIARATGRGTANTWMGQGATGATGDTTGWMRPIRAAHGQASVAAELTVDPNRIRFFTNRSLCTAAMHADIAITSGGVTTRYASATVAVDATLADAALRYAKARGTVGATGEQIGWARALRHTCGHGVCSGTFNAVLDYGKIRNARVSATATTAGTATRLVSGFAPIACEGVTTDAAVRLARQAVVLNGEADVVDAAVRLARVSAEMTGEAALPSLTPQRYAYAHAETAGVANAQDSAMVYSWRTGAAAAKASMEAAPVIIVSLSGECASEAIAEGSVTRAKYSHGEAYAEATAVASMRAGESLQAAPQRTYRVAANDRVVTVAYSSRTMGITT